MRRRDFLVLSLSLACSPLSAWAEHRTVVDYYRLLPRRFFLYPERRMELLRWGGTLVDVPNGYLAIPGDGGQSNLEMAIFRLPDDGYLTAVTTGGDRGGIYEQTLCLLALSNSALVDVTQRSLPRPFDARLRYILPRFGTTIQVTSVEGVAAYDLSFRQGQFHAVDVNRALRAGHYDLILFADSSQDPMQLIPSLQNRLKVLRLDVHQSAADLPIDLYDVHSPGHMEALKRLDVDSSRLPFVGIAVLDRPGGLPLKVLYGVGPITHPGELDADLHRQLSALLN